MDSKQHYFVMEFIKYSLKEYAELSSENQTVDAYIKMFKQMLGCLKELHEAGFVHQDVKDENFRVNRIGQIRIFDFGLLEELYEENRVHINQKHVGFNGSPYFASINALSGLS